MSYGIVQRCPETGDDKVGFLSFRFFLVHQMILEPHKTPCLYHFELFEGHRIDQKSFPVPFSLLLNALKVEVIANYIIRELHILQKLWIYNGGRIADTNRLFRISQRGKNLLTSVLHCQEGKF